jgi:monoamine oxidase
VAIPASVLRNIPSDFLPETNAAIKSIEYTSAAKLAFQSVRFWESDEQIFGGSSLTDEDITQVWYPNEGFGTKEGILIGAYIYGGPAGENFARLDPQQRIELALSQGSKIHPNYRANMRAGISRSWLKTPYSLGGWSVTPPPIALQQPDGPFIFAGEHTTYLNSTQEGAVISAHRAIELLLGSPANRVQNAVASSLASNFAVGTPKDRMRAIIR